MYCVYSKKTGQVKMVCEEKPTVDLDIFAIKKVTNQSDLQKVLSGHRTEIKDNILSFKPLIFNQRQQTIEEVKTALENAKTVDELKIEINKLIAII